MQLRERTLDIYVRAADHAARAGIILADTKFEFGVDDGGNLVLADEVFTPDSSRYWRRPTYEAGVVQPSFDKQFVRNWLTGPESGWDRDGDTPPPALPPHIVDATRARYIEAYERISGLSLRRLDRLTAMTAADPARRQEGSAPSASITATCSSTTTSGCATRTTRR